MKSVIHTWLVGAELASALGLGGLAPRNNLTRTLDVTTEDSMNGTLALHRLI